MMLEITGQFQHRADRLACNQRRRGDFAAPDRVEGLDLRQADFFDLDYLGA
jgi:hypothetical protein